MSPRLLAIALAFLGVCMLLLDSAAPLIDRLVIGAACLIGAVIVWRTPDTTDITQDLLRALVSAGLDVEHRCHPDGAVISTLDRRAKIAHTIVIAHGRVRSVTRSGFGRLDVWAVDEVIEAVTQPA